MKRFANYFFLFLFLFSCSGNQNNFAKLFSWEKKSENKSLIFLTLSEKKIVPRLDSLFAVNVSEHGFNGSVLIARHGRIIYKRLYGVSEKKSQKLLRGRVFFTIKYGRIEDILDLIDLF